VSGGFVFKRGRPADQSWMADALGALKSKVVRWAEPVLSINGEWAVDGWTATRLLKGSEPDLSQPSSWLGVVKAGRAFHQAVVDVPRPSFLDAREDAWALADRLAWAEHSMPLLPEFTELARRFTAPRVTWAEPQLVHGDLTTNVLFAPGLPPAVIDISPYWRPPAYAEAVVAADGLCWHGADASVLTLLELSVGAVARALLFRMATANALALARTGAVDPRAEGVRFKRAADSLGL
jgi:hypothetical protein